MYYHRNRAFCAGTAGAGCKKLDNKEKRLNYVVIFYIGNDSVMGCCRTFL